MKKKLLMFLISSLVIVFMTGCDKTGTFSIGDKISSDILELTLDKADLTFALENMNENTFFLPKEYNANEDNTNLYVASKGHTLVAMTYNANNLDRGSVEVDNGNKFITVEYKGKKYSNTIDYIVKASSNDNGNSWERTGTTNLVLPAGKNITIRCYVDIPVEVKDLKDAFKLTFSLPNSEGKTTSFTYVINR